MSALAPAPTWADLHSAVEQIHGREIVVGPAPKSLGPMVTGVWLQTDLKSYIFHDEGSVKSEVFVRHIVAHEYGHILLRHSGCELTLGTAFEAVGKPKNVREVLARSESWTTQELEAEAIAVELMGRMCREVDAVVEIFG
jgi:hypothetical protein